MDEKKYPYPMAKGVHIPKTKWLCDAILNGDIQIDYEDEYPAIVTNLDIARLAKEMEKYPSYWRIERWLEDLGFKIEVVEEIG